MGMYDIQIWTQICKIGDMTALLKTLDRDSDQGPYQKIYVRGACCIKKQKLLERLM